MSNYEVQFSTPSVTKVVNTTSLERAKILCQAERIHEGHNIVVTYAQKLDYFTPISESNRLFDSHGIIVYHNGSGEVFVEPKDCHNAAIRVSGNRHGLAITCALGRLIPSEISGLSAIRTEGK